MSCKLMYFSCFVELAASILLKITYKRNKGRFLQTNKNVQQLMIFISFIPLSLMNYSARASGSVEPH